MQLITEQTVVSAPKAILNKWLVGYFDGGMHPIGSNPPTLFPKVNIRFGQSAPERPLSNDQKVNPDGISSEIRIIIIRRNEVSRTTNDIIAGLSHTVTIYSSIQFWINTKATAQGAADVLADNIGQLLKALLTNPQNRVAMANSGIRHLLPQEPEVIQSTDFTKRLLTCTAEMFYTLKASNSPTPPPVPDIDPLPLTDFQDAIFTREAPMIQGDYFGGAYRWPNPRIITGLYMVGLGAQDVDTQFTLELNGTLTAIQITLPMSDPAAESSAEINGEIFTIPTNAVVRWIVTTGSSDPALGPRNVSLMMQTT